MANMSYCMWENTFHDLDQLIDDLGEAIGADEPSIKDFLHSKNETERVYIGRVLEAATELLRLYEQLEQYDEN